MTSEYEKHFGRLIPEGYKEVPCCLNCGTTGLHCPCEYTGALKKYERKEACRLVHLDNTMLSEKEKKHLYRPAVRRQANALVAQIIKAGEAGTQVFHGTRAMDEVSKVMDAVAKRDRRARKRLADASR